MKFRKKPVEIEATQWFPNIQVDDVIFDPKISETFGFIETLEGRMKVTPGDFIITGVAGEKYACKEDIFYKTYDPA